MTKKKNPNRILPCKQCITLPSCIALFTEWYNNTEAIDTDKSFMLISSKDSVYWFYKRIKIKCSLIDDYTRNIFYTFVSVNTKDGLLMPYDITKFNECLEYFYDLLSVDKDNGDRRYFMGNLRNSLK